MTEVPRYVLLTADDRIALRYILKGSQGGGDMRAWAMDLLERYHAVEEPRKCIRTKDGITDCEHVAVGLCNTCMLDLDDDDGDLAFDLRRPHTP